MRTGLRVPFGAAAGGVARLNGIPTYTTMFNSMVVVEVSDDYSISYE